MTRIVKIKNNTSVVKNYKGQNISPGAYYQIKAGESAAWGSDDSLLKDVARGYVLVNDGTNDLTNINDGINWLKNIEPMRTDDNRLRVATEKSDTSTVTLYSHNWSDSTTWYEGATRVVDEVASNSGDQLTYTLSNTHIIDVYHGKITGEDDLKTSDGYSYRVTVKVNDTGGYTEQDPHYGTGEDYVVNYHDGYVVFLNALQPSDEVKVTYYYAQSSVFTIKPTSGKKLTIEVVEVQFSEDVDIKDSTRFDVYGLVEVYAPQLTPSPYPAGTLIPIRKKVYKTINDFQNDAVKAYSKYPALGGASWRGMSQPVLIFDWDYLRGSILTGSTGMEIRVTLEHDAEFGGAYATATFYCSVENES